MNRDFDTEIRRIRRAERRLAVEAAVVLLLVAALAAVRWELWR